MLPGLVSTNEITVPGDLQVLANQRPVTELAENALSGLFPVLLLLLPEQELRSWTGPDTERLEITPRHEQRAGELHSEEEEDSS